jgi:hypothetical protein
MSSLRMAAAAFAVLSLGLTALPVAAAGPQCKARCNTTYQQCLGAKSQDACLKGWSQCKRTCLGVAPISTTVAPTAAKPVPATPRR